MSALPRACALLVTVLTAFVAPAAGAADAWTLAQAERPLEAFPAVRETRWTTPRPPGGSHDRLELHRYRGASPGSAVLVYLPGTHMNGEVAVADEDHNLWLFLAARGVDVYALDYRTRFVPATGVSDLGFMKDWTLEAFVGDARAAVEKARAESGAKKVFLAGFSRGVSLAYATALREPRDGVAGLIALDGAFKSHAPKGRFDRTAALADLETKAAWASDVAGSRGWEWRRQLVETAAERPGAPAASGSGRTAGQELAEVLYSAWRPGGLANAREGRSTPAVLGRLLAGYDRFYPAVQDVDNKAIGDFADHPATALDDGWGTLTAPVLYFGATNMGVQWLLDGIASAGGAGSPDVTIHVLEGYGHLDVVAGDQARREVFEPALAWIRKRSES